MIFSRNALLVLHFIGLAGLLGGLFSQFPAKPKRIIPGAIHSALISLITGIALVGVESSIHASDPTNWDAVDNAKFGVKGLVLGVILTIGYRNIKKDFATTRAWGALMGLTILNIVIAVFW